MNIVDVRGVRFNEGAPKICIPLVGKTDKEILDEVAYVKTLDIEVIEWRIDHYEHVLDHDKLLRLARLIQEEIEDKILLTTFRSFKEGGVLDINDETYVSIYEGIIQNKTTDMIDIELFMPEEMLDHLVSKSKENGITVILCNHDFDKTVSKEEIIRRLKLMQKKQADICKIALMPKTKADVITLLDATQEMYEKHAKCPLITMSMGGLGAISRIAGEVFGSSMTFGVGRKASAPGQIEVDALKASLDVLHQSLTT